MIGIVSKKELDLRALPLGELPVTDLGHVFNEIRVYAQVRSHLEEVRIQNKQRVIRYAMKKGGEA